MVLELGGRKGITVCDFEESTGYRFKVVDSESWTGVKGRVEIKCTTCGHARPVVPRSITTALKDGKNGCLKCSIVDGSTAKGQPRTTFKAFEDEVLQKFSVVNPVEWRGISNRTLIECNDCGEQKNRLPHKLLQQFRDGHDACKNCHTIKQRATLEEFMERTNFEYIVVGEWIGLHHIAEITHVECNHTRLAEPNSIIGMRKSGSKACPYCVESKGSRRVREFFDSNNIEYRTEESYNGLKGIGGKSLRFDFSVIEDGNISFLVEFDGEFHYKPIRGEKHLANQRLHDGLKNDYCLEKNIELVRIPYWEFENIEEILKESIAKYSLVMI